MYYERKKINKKNTNPFLLFYQMVVGKFIGGSWKSATNKIFLEAQGFIPWVFFFSKSTTYHYCSVMW